MRQAAYEILRFLSGVAPLTMFVVFVLRLAGLLGQRTAVVDLVVLLVAGVLSSGLAFWLRPH